MRSIGLLEPFSLARMFFFIVVRHFSHNRTLRLTDTSTSSHIMSKISRPVLKISGLLSANHIGLDNSGAFPTCLFQRERGVLENNFLAVVQGLRKAQRKPILPCKSNHFSVSKIYIEKSILPCQLDSEILLFINL